MEETYKRDLYSVIRKHNSVNTLLESLKSDEEVEEPAGRSKSLERQSQLRARSPGALSQTLSQVMMEDRKPPLTRQAER